MVVIRIKSDNAYSLSSTYYLILWTGDPPTEAAPVTAPPQVFQMSQCISIPHVASHTLFLFLLAFLKAQPTFSYLPWKLPCLSYIWGTCLSLKTCSYLWEISGGEAKIWALIWTEIFYKDIDCRIAFKWATGWNQSFLSPWQLLLFCLFHFGYWELGLATTKGWGTLKYGWAEMWAALHLWLGSCCCQFSRELSPLGGLTLLEASLGLGRIVSFASSLGAPLVFIGLFYIDRNITVCPSLNLTRYLKGFFLFF